MINSELSSSKHGEVEHYPLFTPLKPLTSLPLEDGVNLAPVLSSNYDIPHPSENMPLDPLGQGKSSAKKQHTVVKSTLTKAHEHTTKDQLIGGAAGDLSVQSGLAQAVGNFKPFDGNYYQHYTSEPYVQPAPTVSTTTGVEPVTQREEVETLKDQACGQTDGIDQELPVTTLPYKGLRLPEGLFEPASWRDGNNPGSPKLMDLSDMDNNDLSYYLETLRTVCTCDEFCPVVPCPLHGRGQHSLKRWANDLLDTHSLYKTGNLYAEKHKLVISRDFTSTPSEDSASVFLSEHFSHEEVSVIDPEITCPTSKGKIKQILREKLQAFSEKGQDSGLFDRTVPSTFSSI